MFVKLILNSKIIVLFTSERFRDRETVTKSSIDRRLQFYFDSLKRLKLSVFIQCDRGLIEKRCNNASFLISVLTTKD